jgi:type II restriction/modification system DNA methylase subunit YeeA
MNKAKLKSYAPQARKDFIAAVTARANLLGISEKAGDKTGEKAGQLDVAPSQPQGDVTVIAGQAWPAKVHTQREQLIARIQKDGFAQTMEAVAYTWFNRFAALRYMELHDYLGHGHRALSSEEGTLPDILTHATDLSNLDAANALPGLNAAKVTELKLAGNRDGELYRMLLVAQCNALSRAMPFLFERIDDDSELLLPDNLLRSDSVIAKLVAEIPEEDWAEVEIIGWLYQFYISEKKDQVIGKVVKSEDIPAATQLFTPNWIVQYLVQNSVGRLWLMANPQSTLAKEWPYYITPAEQTPGVQAQLDALIQARVQEDDKSGGDTLGGVSSGVLNPESITVLDPACGSGHILVVAYDVLKAIYLERGYQPRAIPRLILEKNLFGLDIDDRAAQMAGFALLMKARADDRRLFTATDDAGNLQPCSLNVLSLQESKGLDADVLTRALQLPSHSREELPRHSREGGNPEAARNTSGFCDDDLFPGTHPQISLGESSAANTAGDPAIAALIATFEHAKTFGSLIQIPQTLISQLAVLAEKLQLARQNGDLYAKAAAQDLLPLVQQAQVLAMQFDAVVANPPFMGSKYQTSQLKDFLLSNFANAKSDLFSASTFRFFSMVKNSGFIGLMTPFTWMFLKSYEDLRSLLISSNTLTSLIQPEYHAIWSSAAVPICTFISKKGFIKAYEATFIRLTDFYGEDIQSEKTLEAIRNDDCNWKYRSRPDDFNKIPGSPVAYWASSNTRDAFVLNASLIDEFHVRQGLATSNNALFVRYWWEVSQQNVGMGCANSSEANDSRKRWFPFNKGGDYRRWFGNLEHVVDWQNDGERIKKNILSQYPYLTTPDFVAKNPQFYFSECISWSAITSSSFSCRYYPNGTIFSHAGMAAFSKGKDIDLAIGYLNSVVSQHFLKILSPTLNYGAGDISKLPFRVADDVTKYSVKCIDLARHDWNLRETSLDFSCNPISYVGKSNISIEWSHFSQACVGAVTEMKSAEEALNDVLIGAYGLQDELSPEVPESQITLARADREKDCQRLISYAIGCMMGRYSLDEPGLIYAHAGNIGFEPSRYAIFPSDADGIVPITDELWFADDAPSRIREFLRAVWGQGTLEENMAWLAESLGQKPAETPDETIRRYIADKFFKDHLQTYKKRPIYWLFSSGKQGAFQALVYLHRYHEGTLARLRAEYVVPLTGKIQSRIEMLQKDAAAASSTAARNKLAKEVEKLKKKHVELLAYDEQLRHHADMRITLDLDDGVKVNYGKFGELLAETKAVTGGKDEE